MTPSSRVVDPLKREYHLLLLARWDEPIDLSNVTRNEKMAQGSEPWAEVVKERNQSMKEQNREVVRRVWRGGGLPRGGR